MCGATGEWRFVDAVAADDLLTAAVLSLHLRINAVAGRIREHLQCLVESFLFSTGQVVPLVEGISLLDDGLEEVLFTGINADHTAQLCLLQRADGSTGLDSERVNDLRSPA